MSTLVSADAIIQADATIIVGIIFLATLREALELPIGDRYSFFMRIFVPIGLFIASAVGAVLEEAPFYWMLARLGFVFGMLALCVSLYLFGQEALRQQEKEKLKIVEKGETI